MRITFAIEDAGEDLVAIFHSHTRSPAVPSRDGSARGHVSRCLLSAGQPGRCVGPRSEALRAWRIRDGEVAEAPLEIG